jgi:hypothetical protein
MWFTFKSKAGNYLRIETKGFHIFDNNWGGIPYFWELEEIVISSADIPIGNLQWYADGLYNIFPPTWNDEYFVSLAIQPSNGNAVYGKFLYQNIRKYLDSGKVEFFYNLKKENISIVSTDLNPPSRFKKFWWDLKLGKVIRFLFSPDYLLQRTFPYFQPTVLFVQAKTYSGDIFFEHLLNFNEIPVRKDEKILQRILGSTIRVRCWQSEFHFQKKLPPKFVKDFWVAKRFPRTARCFVYSNYADAYDMTEINIPYTIFLFIDKYESTIKEIAENLHVAIPPQLWTLLECLYRLPTDRRGIRVLQSLNCL